MKAVGGRCALGSPRAEPRYVIISPWNAKPSARARAELSGRPSIFRVVAGLFARRGGVQTMVDVVVPLRGVTLNLAFGPSCQQMRLVLLILQNKMDLAHLPERPAHPLRQLVQEMHRAVVHDGVDRIEAQPVEMKLLQPVERVVDHELPHRRRISAIVVDRAPQGVL